MVELIVRTSRYGKQHDAGFLVFPQNSPELRNHPGYADTIDGLGIEELFITADDRTSDRPCVQARCSENLADVLALRDAGKVILAVDYASDPANVAAACERYEDEGFAGYVTSRALDRSARPAPDGSWGQGTTNVQPSHARDHELPHQPPGQRRARPFKDACVGRPHGDGE